MSSHLGSDLTEPNEPRSPSAVSFSNETSVKNSKQHRSTRRVSVRMSPRREMPTNRSESPESEELLDDEVLLSRLQAMFNSAEEEGRTGLNRDEFKEAMRKTVGRNSTDDEIDILFMKVDANCDGFLDWEEYVTFNLLEYKEKSLMIEMLREQPFPNDIHKIENKHRDIIIRIRFYPNIKKIGSTSCHIDNTNGKYVTISKEGTIGIWNLSMRNLKYYNANDYQDRNTHPWFTDMVVMGNVNMLAIASTNRDITVFDVTGNRFRKRYFLTGFEYCVTTMDYWFDPTDLNKAILLIGDTSGSVVAMKFATILRGGLFGKVDDKKSCKRVGLHEVLRGFMPGVKAIKFPNIHEDWVNKVQYLPEISCFLSCCQGPETALFFADLTGKKSHVFFKVNKGVLSFDYSYSLNIIVTGGMDYILRVWNPYVNNKAIVLLKGHIKPVNHLIINSPMNQVISIDKGRSLRVYDLRDQACIQQVSGRILILDGYHVSAVFFNARMRTMLLAANQLVLLQKSVEEEQHADVVSHNKPIVAALYSKVFGSVVSACHDSVISVWDSNTGDKLIQFVNAHFRMERGVSIPIEITAMCFDHNGRRLVTGATNGTVHIWNYNNGSRMQQFTLPDNSDVTGLVCTKQHIYVTGWGKAVYIYSDGEGEEFRRTWSGQHKEDILSIAYLPPNIIATGAYDGNVILWFRETGLVYSRMNAFESVKPIIAYNITHGKGHQAAIDAITLPTVPTVTDDEKKLTKHNMWSKPKNFLSGSIALGFRGKLSDAVAEDDATILTSTAEKLEHPLLKVLDMEAFSEDNQSNYSRVEYDDVCKRYESAVEKILFLGTREPIKKDTAVLVTSGAEGWIRFWSMHHEGGLLGQFNAAHRLGESVLAMKCDTNEHYLMTGDTQGYVKIWAIRNYCTGNMMTLREHSGHIKNMCKKFTYFRVENYEEQKHNSSFPNHLKNVFTSRPPPASSDPEHTLKYPLLVNSFRAHTRSIQGVEFVSDRDIIITASVDCSVRMWTVNGQYIGTFGESWKHLPKVVTTEYFVEQIPIDIRRSASARTLKCRPGDHPHHVDFTVHIHNKDLWAQPKCNGRASGFRSLYEVSIPQAGAIVQWKGLIPGKACLERYSLYQVMHGGKTPMWQSAFSIIRRRGLKRLKDQLEQIERDNMALENMSTRKEESVVQPTPLVEETNNILGKSFKRTTRHRMPPTLPKFIETPGSVAIYRALSLVDLTPINAFNEQMKGIQERRVGMQTLNMMKGIRRPKKQEVPNMLTVLKKLTKKSAPVKRFGYTSRISKMAETFKGPLTNQAPEKNKEISIKSVDGSGDVSQIERSKCDMGGAETSSNESCSPIHFKVDAKLPPIVE